MDDKTLNIVVFASGGGSNFKAIHNAIEKKILNARVVLLVASKRNIGASEFAQEKGIPVKYYIKEEYSSYDTMIEEFIDEFKRLDTELIVLAGFLKLVDSRIVSNYRNRIMNIHPALLPSFGGKGYYGIRVHEAVLEYGAKVTGVTIHFVDEEYDHGPVIMQKAVYVEEGDTPEVLQKRVLVQEHDTYWRAIKLYQENRIKVEGRTVKILGKIDDSN